KKVLSTLNDEVDLVIVDAEVRNADMSMILEKSRLNFDRDREYRKGDEDKFFVDVANHLSFIGCVIIQRDFWLSRERTSYFGTVFIHVGVIFQHPPPEKIHVISEPLVMIRYGNAMWTSRAFDIWMFKWPKLIWSFSDYSDNDKKSICLREPWRKIKAVFHYRAKGAYSIKEFKKYFLREKNLLLKFILFIIAVIPAKLTNFLSVIYVFKNKSFRLSIYELSLSQNASILSLYLSRRFRK
ncbi:MAG: glycosyltransferase family 2 protein, partial [Gammaproteobacteria bacterium]|nr:glycosyltransferase family 2 protein [Gammaproteobacteria bacterium]